MSKNPPSAHLEGLFTNLVSFHNLSLKLKMRSLFIKRVFDFIISLVGIVISSPFWVVFALMILVTDGRPIIYRQDRVGRNGRVFKAFKFRSMIKNAEEENGPVQATENDPRVTKVGKLLRATAMDELPQLFNILRGDMSFVGPRALRPAEIEVHGNADLQELALFRGFKERHSIRPGLTGLAQIYLPSDAPRWKKFRYDILYLKKRSLWVDVRLIFLSFLITFRAKWESRQKKI